MEAEHTMDLVLNVGLSNLKRLDCYFHKQSYPTRLFICASGSTFGFYMLKYITLEIITYTQS